MTERREGFLARQRAREASRELTQHLVLGYGIGLILLGFGAYKHFLDPAATSRAWALVAAAGGLAMVVTLVLPSAWGGLEGVIRGFGNWVGHRLMGAVLAAAYFGVVWPVGAVLRARRGTHPIYEWQDGVRPAMQGWHDKGLPYDLPRHGEGRGSGRIGLFKVVLFFARRGYLVFVPLVVILASLGIALFFLQTSALAPFIYTLF